MGQDDPWISKQETQREMLAFARTRLANERTLLAYARTSLAFFAAGLTGVHLLEFSAWWVLSWIFVALGPVIALIGVARFFGVRRTLDVRRMDLGVSRTDTR